MPLTVSIPFLDDRTVVCNFEVFCMSDDMCNDSTKYCDLLNM